MEHFILNYAGPLLLCDQSAHTRVMNLATESGSSQRSIGFEKYQETREDNKAARTLTRSQVYGEGLKSRI